jgi:hypothetical protein
MSEKFGCAKFCTARSLVKTRSQVLEPTANLSRHRAPGRRAGLWLGWLGVLLLFVALRWNSYDAPLTRDEGEYAYAAQLLRHGLAPYEHSFLQKPPMVVYSYALADIVAPKFFWFPRIVAYLFAAGATVLLGYIARSEFGTGVALSVAWLMTPMILLPGLEQFTANTEMFMLLPLLATAALYVRSRHSGGGFGYWFAGGLLGAATIYYKYNALPLLAVIFAAWSFHEWRTRKNCALLCQYWLFALLGAIIASAAALGFFLVRDGGKRLWECTVLFNRFYAASGSFGLSELGHRLLTLWHSWWILFVAPCVFIILREPRIWFWLGLFLVAWITTAASRYGHYYIVVMPFWALLTAVALRGFVVWLGAKLSLRATYLNWGFTSVAVFVLCWSDVPWLIRTKQQFAADKMRTRTVFLESQVVARRVAELTTPQDYVCVAGSEPQILCYAHRFSPTRFVIAYPMMIPSPVAKTYQLEAIRDLKERPPAVVVMVRLSASWLVQNDSPPDFLNYLAQLLDENYDLLGGYLIDNDTGRWQEPLALDDMGRASLLLFKRGAR